MKHFEEIRTIAKVATLGAVSAVAREFGVHRSTVQRHVDTLERVLAASLFIQHSGGYTPTQKLRFNSNALQNWRIRNSRKLPAALEARVKPWREPSR